ncbi:MAG: PHA/PHB synthase family protein [Paracoccaceae bacterium]
MATQTTDDAPDGDDGPGTAMEANLARLDALSRRLTAALGQGRAVPQGLSGPGADFAAQAGQALMRQAMTDPAELFARQAEWWATSVRHWMEAQQALLTGSAPGEVRTDDRRFRDRHWHEHPWFNLIMRQYMTNAEAMMAAAAEAPGLDPRQRRRLTYFTRQIADMLAPTNFLATNPEALSRAVETEGESLVKGLENLVRDLEAGGGDLIVRLADEDAFEVGRNLATTPGEVVFRNDLLELIQYAPTTGQVHEIPLVIFPPWINKFYILDLTERNSFVRWAVARGFTVFVASWANPDPSWADVSMTDYVERGFLAAIDAARAIRGTRTVNAIGYCIAGTTLSATLGVMKTRGRADVASATFFTTLTDFSDQGEVGVFLEDDFLTAIAAEARAQGMLDALYMQRTFSYLRSNDLIYGPAIRSYMLGETPPAFDLLYWNGDSTNLAGDMAVDYLLNLCRDDRLANGQGFEVAGHTVHLRDVDVPLMAIACETDHIANWAQSFRGVGAMGAADRTFVLSESGHIAGIVNPPSKKKYGHYVTTDLTADPADWRAGAARQDGSWWPLWADWLAERSGGMVDAPAPGGPQHPSLGPAPGTYVHG